MVFILQITFVGFVRNRLLIDTRRDLGSHRDPFAWHENRFASREQESTGKALWGRISFGGQ
jgi:hypothetical protein